MDRKSSSLSQVLPNEISMKQEIEVLKWNQSFTEWLWLTDWLNLRFKFKSKRLNDFGRLTFNHLLSVEVMIELYLNVANIKDKNSFFMYSMMTVSKTIYQRIVSRQSCGSRVKTRDHMSRCDLRQRPIDEVQKERKTAWWVF